MQWLTGFKSLKMFSIILKNTSTDAEKEISITPKISSLYLRVTIVAFRTIDWG